MPTQKEVQEDFNNRVQEVITFAKEKEVFIGAVQQINKETGYIEIVPLYRDMKQYTKDVETVETPNA